MVKIYYYFKVKNFLNLFYGIFSTKPKHSYLSQVRNYHEFIKITFLEINKLKC